VELAPATRIPVDPVDHDGHLSGHQPGKGFRSPIEGGVLTLSIENVTVTYRDGDHALLALDRVDLTLEPGRITGLVGESGSGKTTLAKTLMGLLPDNAEISGTVGLDEIDLTGMDETRLNKIRWARIAMVFQNGVANLNPVHTIIDQVAEPLIQHGQGEKQEAHKRAIETLVRMGLKPEQGHRFPHELSGGEVQRVLLAMALIMAPEVLILDEPTSALDAITKAFVAHIIQDVAEKGTSVLLITHDLDLADKLADALAVLYMGQILETMPARDLLLNPCHPYTLALGRSYPSMNTLRELGGIRGDAFYRLTHRHSQEIDRIDPHSHIIGAGSFHEDGHAPPAGCLFQPRCTQAVEDCLGKDMPMLEAEGHRVRCLRGGIASRLELKGVSKRYDNVTALCPTNLNLRSGEVFCLVGETGSGKTTLSMIAAGVLNPDHGQRVFDGSDMDEWRKRSYRSLARRIGVIYQNPAEAVSHHLSVFDIVAEPLRIQGVVPGKDEIQDRVKSVLADVRLSTEAEFLKRYPHELNMGAVQRVCIARALVLEPSLLVADEPTSSLDPSVQAKVLKLLMDLQTEKGLTMLFVTHDIGLARKIGDRIGVMLAGNIVEAGPSVQVMGNPLHPYTRLLIRSAAGRAGGFSSQAKTPPQAGCPFSPRCRHTESVCFSKLPPEVNPDGGYHLVRCFRPQMSANVAHTENENSPNAFASWRD
jgi:peptide/nickel transport system ATP-binding protein